jgi:RNA polymerase sigma-70 factor, ECF subfamily
MDDKTNDERIVQLIGSCQHSLLIFMYSLLGSRELAEDALQDANVILWRKRDEYLLGTNFLAWARRIAYLEACNLRKQRKNKVPVFSELFMQEISVDFESASSITSSVEAFLKECVNLLDDPDRSLLERRYNDGATPQAIAAELEQSVRSVYRNLERIHGRLFKCISEKNAESEGVKQ